MRWRLGGAMLLVCAGSAAAASDDLPQDVLLLAHFKGRMRQALSQVLNYTCLESIQRLAQGPGMKSFSRLDTLLLEVSTVSGTGAKELLAWPGARRFEKTDPSSFANGGLMGTGIFALFARTVFLDSATIIEYSGAADLAGRRAARFDFRIPEVWSHYEIQANGAKATVGANGSFWIDPISLELLRMEVRASEIPEALGLSGAVTIIDYAPMHIGDAAVLLPQDAKMLLMLVSGEVRRNDIAFSHCHEYSAESSIRFDLADSITPAAAPPARIDLPAGLTLSIALDTAIDSTTAHVGDLLRGHVVDDVRRKGKALMVPKGANVTGRIRGLERSGSTEPAFDLTIEIARLDWENSSAEFYGELLPKGSDRQIPGTGVLHIKGTQFHIDSGLRMNWRTLEPSRQGPSKTK
ncbi:MAG: hypothetical protein ABSG65_27105 [Bryobacteraceae bacterium]